MCKTGCGITALSSNLTFTGNTNFLNNRHYDLGVSDIGAGAISTVASMLLLLEPTISSTIQQALVVYLYSNQHQVVQSMQQKVLLSSMEPTASSETQQVHVQVLLLMVMVMVGH